MMQVVQVGIMGSRVVAGGIDILPTSRNRGSLEANSQDTMRFNATVNRLR